MANFPGSVYCGPNSRSGQLFFKEEKQSTTGHRHVYIKKIWGVPDIDFGQSIKLAICIGGTGFQPVRRTGKMPVPPRTFRSSSSWAVMRP
jgi:hypothetical protein